MYLLISFPLLLFSTISINSLFKLRSRITYFLGNLIISYAAIVLVGEITSLINLITPLSYVIAHILIAFGAWYAWYKAGKPSLLGPFSGGKWKIWRELPAFEIRPALYILAIGVVMVYLLGAGLIILVPQNNYDSMTYHLSRVGYWMQHQNMSPWLTPNPRQTTSPINAELGLLWTTLLIGTDRLTGFVQWFSAIGISVAIYGIARLMGAKQSQGVFASLLWMSFPPIVMQSTTTQNDLAVSFFFLSMFYFLFLGVKKDNPKALLLSGASFGLAMGTKATFFVALPGLGLAVLIIWAYTGRIGFNRLFTWGISGLVGIGLLGIFNYVQNYIHYEDPFSIPEWTAYITGADTGSSRLSRGFTNLALYASNFLDVTGSPKGITETITYWKTDFLRKVFFESGIPFRFNNIFSSAAYLESSTLIHEDTSWFGPFSFLLIPVTLYQSYIGIKKRDYIRIGLVITGIGFWVTLSFLMGWTPYRVRYFVLAVSILAPLMAFLYQSSKKRKLFYELIAIFAVWVMVSTVFQNATKPLIGPNAIWGLTRNEIRTLTNPKMEPVLEMVQEKVPPKTVLATRLGVDHWDYVLFGDKFDRKIIQLDPNHLGIDENNIWENKVDYLLLAPRERSFIKTPAYLDWVEEVDGWYLFKVSETGSAEIPEEVKQKLLGQTDAKRLLEIDQSLVGTVGLTELYTTDWDVEQYEGDGFMWLGEGLNQGLSGFLWSEVEVPIKLSFHLEPGPSREDPNRSLRIGSYRYGPYGPIREGVVNFVVEIDKPVIYEMVVDLQRGLNEFRIFALDYATIPVLPNGDKRPLLVKLTDIDVLPLAYDANILSLDEGLDGNIKVNEQYLAEWGIEYVNEQPFLWLGEGLNQGFRGLIWSEMETVTRIVLHLSPGPSIEDPNRRMELSFGQYGNFEGSDPLSKILEFNSPIEYTLDVTLHKGLNQLELAALDQAEIEMLPNGDTRPLLIQLKQIELLPLDE